MFYCPDALADGNQHIQISGKMLEIAEEFLFALCE